MAKRKELKKDNFKTMQLKLMMFFCILTIVQLAIAEARNDTTRIRSGYQSSLEIVLDALDKKKLVKSKKIAFVIPETRDESKIFFSYDYKQETSEPFRRLLARIDSLSLAGKEEVVERFIKLSQFVDGYFAEDYFISAMKLYAHQQDLFCKTLKATDAKQKQRLIDYGLNCIGCKKCDLDWLYLSHKTTYSESEIKGMLCSIDSSCANNVEFSEVSNEILFAIFLKEPQLALKILNENPDFDVSYIMRELKDPINDGINVKKVYESVAHVRKYETLKRQALKSLQVAIDRQ